MNFNAEQVMELFIIKFRFFVDLFNLQPAGKDIGTDNGFGLD